MLRLIKRSMLVATLLLALFTLPMSAFAEANATFPQQDSVISHPQFDVFTKDTPQNFKYNIYRVKPGQDISDLSTLDIEGNLTVSCDGQNLNMYCWWTAKLTDDKFVYLNITIQFQKSGFGIWSTFDEQKQTRNPNPPIDTLNGDCETVVPSSGYYRVRIYGTAIGEQEGTLAMVPQISSTYQFPYPGTR
ncbi:hypothetical protein LJK88_42720 [Paenibacillus sp. P26]|nr:hypothetical protein LJK88_42720 [Paenibacillus sp. P26]UUZ92525.1 hypothetical protein LJK87_45560 [Paenibacillus sp. P25]